MEFSATTAVFWFVMLVAYFLPLAVAIGREHHNTGGIGALNVLLGWTLLGWLAALIWAFTAVRPGPLAAPKPTPETKPAPEPFAGLSPEDLEAIAAARRERAQQA